MNPKRVSERMDNFWRVRPTDMARTLAFSMTILSRYSAWPSLWSSAPVPSPLVMGLLLVTKREGEVEGMLTSTLVPHTEPC